MMGWSYCFRSVATHHNRMYEGAKLHTLCLEGDRQGWSGPCLTFPFEGTFNDLKTPYTAYWEPALYYMGFLGDIPG